MRRNIDGCAPALFLLAVPLALLGCTKSPDLNMRNPLTAGAVDSNRIVKSHEPTEDRFGLPRHALDDEAQLLSVDAERLCFGVTLREIDPIDLREMEAELASSSAKTPAPAELRESQVAATSHAGRVPMRQQHGYALSCTKRDDARNCIAYDESPKYSTTFVPGTVEVFQANGTICFPKSGLLTRETEHLTLKVKVRRRAPREPGWGSGARTKDVSFRWGFGNGAPTGALAAR